MMYVTYFDEVKADPGNGQTSYFIGGLCVPMERIGPIEKRLNDLANRIFGTTDLTPDTEFHASDIYRRKGAFKSIGDASERVGIIIELAKIIADEDAVKRVFAAIDTTRLYNPDHGAQFAFAHFCERVQMAVGRQNSSIMIGDLDDAHAKNMIRDFAKFRANGTPWEYGVEITSIVDSVHFGRSHHSRMIQLADAYLFTLSHRSGSRKGWMAEKLTKELESLDLFPHRYKVWPRD